MSERPTIPSDDQAELANEPRGLPAYGWGLLAGIGVALAYGLSAELFGLSWGLVAVAFVGGMVIGGAVSRGAWQDQPHTTVRGLQVTSTLIAVGAWMLGVLLAFVISQALLPQAATPLLERLSLERFWTYFAGLDDSVRLIHAASLAALAFMAWRGAR